MSERDNPTRRDILLGKLVRHVGEASHVSSAVVRALPSSLPRLLPTLAALEGVEVVASENGRIVLVIEGAGSGDLGRKLMEINLLEGVLAASMVFEQAYSEEGLPHDAGAEPS